MRCDLAGERPVDRCRALGHSTPWLYTWLTRDDPATPAWAQRHSRAPHRLASKTPEAVERLVCERRQRLVQTREAQRGPLAMQWQLPQLGVEPLPALWTISRLLKRHGLVGQPSSQPRGTPSPPVAAPRPNGVHQLDLVGPRELRGGERFSGVHLMAAPRHAVALAARPSQPASDVVEALVAGWQTLGLPRDLQQDHERSCRGSTRHPRSFGRLIRLCRYLGVAVVFIPERAPWRNGIVERCTAVDDQRFWRPQPCRNLAHIRQELPHFETFHHTQQRDAKLGQRPPGEVHTASTRRGSAHRGVRCPGKACPGETGASRASASRMTKGVCAASARA
jgi:hypothetical protein